MLEHTNEFCELLDKYICIKAFYNNSNEKI